jgi:hypothetical protein
MPSSRTPLPVAQRDGTSVKSLIGDRTPRGLIVPEELNGSVDRMLHSIEALESAAPVSSVDELKRRFSQACRLYYTVAAVSRRRVLNPALRTQLLKQLYPLRSQIERVVVRGLNNLTSTGSVLSLASQKSFFGVSAKQGVSIRYPLLTCIPTAECGGRCYAHDGRDRELHLLFRAALNYWVGSRYEAESTAGQELLIGRLSNSINHAVRAALADAEDSARAGWHRAPRIRFSHVGEMAATPNFTNRLAREIAKRNPVIACVIYTRHPRADRLDTSLLHVNFTLEGVDDTRRRFVPQGARIVNSAWDGRLDAAAAVNFLEHHVEKKASAVGDGHVCPVTANHDVIKSCDSARCDLCFRPPLR